MGCGSDGLGFDLDPWSCIAASMMDDEFMIAVSKTSLDFDLPLQFDFNDVLMGASLTICVAYCIPFGMWRTPLTMTPAAFSEACTI